MSAERKDYQDFTVGDWTVRPSLGRIEGSGQQLTAEPLAMAILVYLARHPGKVIATDELIREVWSGQVVGDNTVYQWIHRLRKTLGDDPRQPRYLDTIPKKGYRLLAPVVWLESPDDSHPVHQKRWRSTVATAVMGIVILVGGVYLIQQRQYIASAPPPITYPIDQRSVAVLPFTNYADGEDQVQFVDGIHDDILTMLARIGSVKVISRTSVMAYRDTGKNLRTIGEELGVATILEGGVQRVGNAMRINVQLVDARTDEHLWAESFDRELTAENVFAIQSEIATAVSVALQTELTLAEKQRLVAVPTRSLDAYEAYLFGKHYLAKHDRKSFTQAVNYFQQAIEIDPDFVLAYLGMADTYMHQYDNSPSTEQQLLVQAEVLVRTALELDDSLGEAYTSYGGLKSYTDPAAAEAAYQRAIKLAPNYSTTYLWYGHLLGQLGRWEESLVQLKKALQLDPLSVAVNGNLARSLRNLYRNEEAMAQDVITRAIDPDYHWSYAGTAAVHFSLGRMDKAVAWYRESLKREPREVEINAFLGYAYLELGDFDKAEYWSDRSLELGPGNTVGQGVRQFLHLYRGETEQAVKIARENLAKDPWMHVALLRNHDLKEGKIEQALARYQQVHPALLDADRLVIDDSNYGVAVDLALVLKKAGQQDRADQLLDLALSHIQTMPRFDSIGQWMLDASIYSLQGQTELALNALHQSIDGGWRIMWRYYLEFDPNLESIRDEPEFRAMLAEIRADMVNQLARVREKESSGDLAAIPELAFNNPSS